MDGNCLYTTKTVRISLGRAVRIVNGTLRNSGRSIGIAGAIQQALGQNDDVTVVTVRRTVCREVLLPDTSITRSRSSRAQSSVR